MADDAIEIAALLDELGFETPDAQGKARDALIASKLTTPTKQRISAEKRSRVEAVLRERFLVTCAAPACQRARDGREHIQAHDRRHCWICAGSDNHRAIEEAAAAFREAGIRRVVIVGGSPNVHDELRQMAPHEWELRLVIGTDRRTGDAARGDLRWADLVLIWGSSELDHKVSSLYSREPDGRVVLINRRGIAALLEEATRHARGRRGATDRHQAMHRG